MIVTNGRQQEDQKILGGNCDKWSAFGWNSYEINGHSYRELDKYLMIAKKFKKPTALIANTIKGKGIPFMEDDNNLYHRVPNEEELKFIQTSLTQFT